MNLRILVFVCLVGAVSLAGALYFREPSFEYQFARRQRGSAAGFVREMRSQMWLSATEKSRGGEGCTSLAEAIASVSKGNPERLSLATGCVHVNPDWLKWCLTATNCSLFTNEIAAFCDAPFAASSGKGKSYIARTFGEQVIEMREIPEWPVLKSGMK